MIPTRDAPELESELADLLATESPAPERLQTAIERIASAFGARTCTLHRLGAGAAHSESAAPLLGLVAQIGLPPHIAEIAARIPIGKGMAGICAERREPVTVCNLQTDESGVARPAARDTRVAGALVVPIDDGELIGTLGIGMSEDHDYTETEIARIRHLGEILTPLLRTYRQ